MYRIDWRYHVDPEVSSVVFVWNLWGFLLLCFSLHSIFEHVKYDLTGAFRFTESVETQISSFYSGALDIH